jgi:hypothetical protein
VPLRAAHAVEKAGLLDRARSFASDHLLWLLLALSGILVAVLALARRQSR